MQKALTKKPPTRAASCLDRYAKRLPTKNRPALNKAEKADDGNSYANGCHSFDIRLSRDELDVKRPNKERARGDDVARNALDVARA